jgi:hypothetical protein
MAEKAMEALVALGLLVQNFFWTDEGVYFFEGSKTS